MSDKAMEAVHGRLVHRRRVRVLLEHLSSVLPERGTVLDVGCGDGLLSSLVAERCPNLSVRGVDVLARPGTHIPVQAFDGSTLPLADRSVDTIMLVDVVHHAQGPAAFMAEMRRVARKSIVIKDHTRDGLLAGPTLRLMDWVGNARHGVDLPYNYLSRKDWDALFERLSLRVDHWVDRLGIYGFPADLLFGRSLHFVARLVLEPQ